MQQESPLDWAGIHRGEMRNVREMDKAGMSLLPGSDAGAPLVVPGFSLHDELSLLVRAAGLTPAQAVEAATAKSARVAGLGDSLGSIDIGSIADLVVLDANPLLDIANTTRISAVVVNGPALRSSGAGSVARRSERRRTRDWSSARAALSGYDMLARDGWRP